MSPQFETIWSDFAFIGPSTSKEIVRLICDGDKGGSVYGGGRRPATCTFWQNDRDFLRETRGLCAQVLTLWIIRAIKKEKKCSKKKKKEKKKKKKKKRR